MVHKICEEGKEPVVCELFHVTHMDLLLLARVSIAASEKGNEKYVNLNLYSCGCVVGGIIFCFILKLKNYVLGGRKSENAKQCSKHEETCLRHQSALNKASVLEVEDRS